MSRREREAIPSHAGPVARSTLRAVDLSARMDRLANIPLFSGLTRAGLELVAKVATEEEHGLGAVLFECPASHHLPRASHVTGAARAANSAN